MSGITHTQHYQVNTLTGGCYTTSVDLPHAPRAPSLHHCASLYYFQMVTTEGLCYLYVFTWHACACKQMTNDFAKVGSITTDLPVHAVHDRVVMHVIAMIWVISPHNCCIHFVLPLFHLLRNFPCMTRVRVAEWSKAPDSSSGPRMWAWVQIPLLTFCFGYSIQSGHGRGVVTPVFVATYTTGMLLQRAFQILTFQILTSVALCKTEIKHCSGHYRLGVSERLMLVSEHVKGY